MAVMLLESSDPNFSFHLKKHPAGGLVAKSMRQGVLSGWYPNGDTQKFAMYFRDLSSENSFSTDDKNYLDLTQYASTYFVFHAFSTFFNHALKLDPNQAYRDEETGEKYIHRITIPTVQLRTIRTLHHLNEFVGAGHIEITELTEGVDRMGLYRIVIDSDGTFNEFLMRVYILFYLLHADLYASDIVWMEGMITKVVGILNELQAEYFLWYWFKKNVLVKHKFYAELEEKLGKNSRDGKMFLEYGDTQTQRKAFVDKRMAFDLPLLDVGCGEGDYLLPYAKKLKSNGHRIVGVEPDKKIRDKINDKLVDRKQENAKVVHGLDNVDLEGKHDIICIEVIEHMPLEDAKALVLNLLKRDFRKLIISTPNVEFNKFYRTMTGFRHDDHHFEFTRKEFMAFIMDCIESSPDGEYFVRDYGVGDQVGDISMAQAVIITKELSWTS